MKFKGDIAAVVNFNHLCLKCKLQTSFHRKKNLPNLESVFCGHDVYPEVHYGVPNSLCQIEMPESAIHSTDFCQAQDGRRYEIGALIGSKGIHALRMWWQTWL